VTTFGFGSETKIRPVRAPEQVASVMRAMIASGKVQQGERLPEIPLAEALGVSRNTLRTGIAMLVTEGLIERSPNRGAVVRTLSPDDVADIYALRRRFELDALPAVPTAPAEIRAATEQVLADCAAAAHRDDYAEFVEHELAFHAALVAHIGSPRLDRLFAQVLGELRLVLGRLAAGSDAAEVRRVLKSYDDIYAAATRGDVEQAQDLLRAHLDRYESRLAKLAAEAASAPSHESQETG
jgi:DNA-binding GntR family transcriptional regulator